MTRGQWGGGKMVVGVYAESGQVVDGWLLVNKGKDRAHFSFSSFLALIRASCRGEGGQGGTHNTHRHTS